MKALTACKHSSCDLLCINTTPHMTLVFHNELIRSHKPRGSIVTKAHNMAFRIEN